MLKYYLYRIRCYIEIVLKIKTGLTSKDTFYWNRFLVNKIVKKIDLDTKDIN